MTKGSFSLSIIVLFNFQLFWQPRVDSWKIQVVMQEACKARTFMGNWPLSWLSPFFISSGISCCTFCAHEYLLLLKLLLLLVLSLHTSTCSLNSSDDSKLTHTISNWTPKGRSYIILVNCLFNTLKTSNCYMCRNCYLQ